jgi:hypothetical protein
MGRNFMPWYKECNHNNRYNKHNSKCTKHILDMQNEYGRIEEVMGILKITAEGRDMDTCGSSVSQS